MESKLPSPTDGKRIAKNAVVLYLRMIFILAISLYTSRVVLQILGEVDFGVYNVVAGIVSMLGALSGSLSGATARFITVEIGKGAQKVEKIFRCCASVHYILAGLIIVLGETLGLWFVMNKLVIPPDRLTAAFWIFQFAIVSVVIRIISSPYNALIIAYERMTAFAYISFIEVILQLGLVFTLKLLNGDKLIYYGLLLAVTQICIRFIYNIYCKKNIDGANGRWLWNGELSKSILKFAGWSLVGYGAVVGYTQGISVLLNLFFGPVANAARGFSLQIQSGINQLSSNFQMALRSPIIKAYSQDKLTEMHKLLIAHAKFSFYLVLIMVVPIIISTPYILKLWLCNIPQYTVDFTRLTLIGVLLSALNGHTIVAIHATGDIKRFQIIEGLLLLLTLPTAYILLKNYDLSANGVIIVYLLIEFLTQFIRVWIVYPMVKLSPRIYIKKVCLPIFVIMIPITIYTLYGIHNLYSSDFGGLCLNVVVSCMLTILLIWTIGLQSEERASIVNRITLLLNKIK